MPSKNPARSTLSGQVGAAARWGRPNAEELRADLAEQQISDYVRRVVDTAPPLGPERRRRLAALLADSPVDQPAVATPAVPVQGGGAA